MVHTSTKAQVLTLWRNPSVGLTGLTRFQRKLRDHRLHLSLADLKKILDTDPSYHLFTQYTRDKKWNTIVETAKGRGIQIDLMDMSKLATRNKNIHWILCAIDVYSRYAWAYPVKRKTKGLIHQCLKEWLESLPEPPRRITSDAGTEFTSKKVAQLFQQHDITHYVNQVGDKTTTGIVERFNRTLRDLMGRNFTRLGRLYWVQDLPKLVKNYNASVHSTLKVTPEDVWLGRATPESRPIVRERFPYIPGDAVRILLPSGLFDKKAGSEKWSTKIYTVVRREGFKYILKSSDGRELKTKYRPSHLQRVSQSQVLVTSESSPSNSSRTVRAQLAQAAAQRRSQAVLRRHGMQRSQLRTSRLRPSTRRQRLRRS